MGLAADASPHQTQAPTLDDFLAGAQLDVRNYQFIIHCVFLPSANSVAAAHGRCGRGGWRGLRIRAMTLGRQVTTRIFADTGSGKSNTLVLRIVLMLCHMRIDPARLTLISFTNASCAHLCE